MQVGDRVMVLGENVVGSIVKHEGRGWVLVETILNNGDRVRDPYPETFLVHLPYPRQRSHFDEYQEGLAEGFAQKHYEDYFPRGGTSR